MQYLGHSSDVLHGNNKNASYALPRLDRTERKLRTSPIAACSWAGQVSSSRSVTISLLFKAQLDTSTHWTRPPPTLMTAYEVLCLGCEIKESFKLKAVACIFDQAFYAKAMEAFWKHKAQFEGFVITMSGFHLLMTTMLAITGSRFADAGLRDVSCPERNNS